MELTTARTDPGIAAVAGDTSLLDRDRAAVEARLELLLARGCGPTQFHKAMRYSVLGNGQRFRPVLALRVARFCGQENDPTLQAAAAVELLHCASLVVDDLPCMDNQALRRNRPATHVEFGEATALLAAFGLVALAARSVVEVDCEPEHVPRLLTFQSSLLRALDVSGLCEGQEIDLRVPPRSADSLRGQINDLKTVPLFEIAAQAGMLFTHPEDSYCRTIREFAREFGRAFQAVDDYVDSETGDPGEALSRLAAARNCLSGLGPKGSELAELIDALSSRLALRRN